MESEPLNKQETLVEDLFVQSFDDKGNRAISVIDVSLWDDEDPFIIQNKLSAYLQKFITLEEYQNEIEELRIVLADYVVSKRLNTRVFPHAVGYHLWGNTSFQTSMRILDGVNDYDVKEEVKDSIYSKVLFTLEWFESSTIFSNKSIKMIYQLKMDLRVGDFTNFYNRWIEVHVRIRNEVMHDALVNIHKLETKEFKRPFRPMANMVRTWGFLRDLSISSHSLEKRKNG